MIKKMMLINASHDEESRVAIVLNDYLQELDIESSSKALTKGNIYKGTITKVEASLQACFVEYGSDRQGFLPLNEIHPDYWKDDADKSADTRKISIQDVVERKREILVQVVKEERGNKGAALTTFISLAGRYLVLSPNTARGGISRKLSDEDRRSMKEILSQLKVPDNMGLIVRTAGKDQTLESLEWDYSYLRRLWDEIRIKGDTAPSPSLIYLEGDLATRAIRDHFSEDIEEIWVDNHEIYTRTKQFVHAVLPGKEKLVKLYRGKKPLFRHYGIETQCEEIHEREIRLPSGGSIVFDPTEALTSIDVNSSRATKGKHIDDTALATNLEAAEEIARQLRIRDIGGLVVIDFIDMASRKHSQQVEEALRAATKSDKARIQLARISRFGLLEMSRQRLHPSVRESTTEVCPRCTGRGSVRTVESMALQMLTRMEDLAEAGKKPTLIVQVPSDTGEYLMNNKRDNIARIEEVYDVQITLQIRPDLMIPHYRIERQWNENNQQRIEVLEDTSKGKKPARSGRKLKPVKPVVGIPTPPEGKAARPANGEKKGLLSRLITALFGSDKKEQEEEARSKQGSRRRNDRRGKRRDDEQASGEGQRKKRSRGGQRKKQARTEDNRNEQNKSANEDVKQQPQNTEGEQGEGSKRRRRRRRRRPSGKGEDASPQDQENVNAQADNDTGGEQKSDQKQAETSHDENSETTTKRRRRPRRRKNTGEESSGGNESASDQNSNSNEAPVAELPKQRESKSLPAPDPAQDTPPAVKADQLPTTQDNS